MKYIPNKTKKLLLVDDEPTNLQALKQILQHDYQLLFAISGEDALKLAREHKPDLVLLDVNLGDMSGYDVCREIKLEPDLQCTPVLFVSAMFDTLNEAQGFEAGGCDYIHKPVIPAIVKVRVATHLSLISVSELKKTQLQIIQRLGRAAEYRDNETGLHVIRMSNYSHLLALAAGLPEFDAEMILHASPMHDVGKIGVPDHVLLKPGPLNEDEWQVMLKHPEFGSEIIGEHESVLLQTARTIALTHHEKWDGSGYPNGLKGELIPIAGRIVAIADVFDALVSARPYKKAWKVEDALALMQRESGKHFDPDLVPLFIGLVPQVTEIMERFSDNAVAAYA